MRAAAGARARVAWPAGLAGLRWLALPPVRSSFSHLPLYASHAAYWCITRCPAYSPFLVCNPPAATTLPLHRAIIEHAAQAPQQAALVMPMNSGVHSNLPSECSMGIESANRTRQPKGSQGQSREELSHVSRRVHPQPLNPWLVLV